MLTCKRNLVKYCLENGGSIHPLIIDPALTNGTGLMNPSIFVDGGKIRCILRHVNYTLFHSEEKKFHHFYGPLQYIHPEDDCTLTTKNYLLELDDDLNIIRTDWIDTSTFDVPPIWEFVGLEDARLFSWQGALYMSGVRRDTTTNGVGRMELCEIEIRKDSVHEVSRVRLPAPGTDASYCEKNWMPILDKPFHYIKWCNPTEVVKVDPDTKTTVTVVLDESKIIPGVCDFRGGSQVISWNGHYLAVIHEVRLFNSELGRKDGKYFHRVVMWDKDFNLVAFTDLFDFMEGEIEFCCGMAFEQGQFMISFGFQDNAAFIVRFPERMMKELLKIKTEPDFIESSLSPIPVLGVPFVNGYQWLERLVNSIDYPVNELLIINNNGRGEYDERLHALQSKKHSFINHIRVCNLPGNIGCAGAWNLIIKSRPMVPYWVITNHDVAFTPGFLAKLHEYSEQPEIGLVHAHEGEWKLGSWEIFSIKDFVIQKYGLFDENLYPAYEEDMDYFMRIVADGQPIKRILSVGLPFYHGDTIYTNAECYDTHGSQTAKEELDLKPKIDCAQTMNQDEYMDWKWGKGWHYVNPHKNPFDDPALPLTYTSYNLAFIRKKYVGF